MAENVAEKHYFGDIEVDEQFYHVAVCLLAANELRDRGLIEGGPDIDIEFFQGIKKVGQMAGFREPEKEDFEPIVEYFRAGGQFEKDFCDQ